MHIFQIIMLHILNLHNVLCQLALSEAWGEKIWEAQLNSSVLDIMYNGVIL